MAWKFDNLIVGAGFSGLTMAERLANEQGQTSLVVEKRSHIGGNAYDRYDDAGVLIHSYGPHYFRTNSPKIREYLTQFTDWNPVNYQILSWTKGRYWSFPINLNTFEQILGRSSSSEEMEEWLEAKRVRIENPKNSEEVITSQVGWELYEMFFKGYTVKQWKRDPRDLDASVCGRIPIRTNRDDRYLKEDFQALPAAGYTRLFERMLRACQDKVKILLQCDYRELLAHVDFRHLVYSGPIDEFFGCHFGHLPYRSLRFEHESFEGESLKKRLPISGKAGFWQPAMQVNYPNEEAYTRIVEVKHATGQQCENTTIVREYPDDFAAGKERYYPIPAPDSARQYARYKALAEVLEQGAESLPEYQFAVNLAGLPTKRNPLRFSFVGRLATYRYYNMDQVVGMALMNAEKQKGFL